MGVAANEFCLLIVEELRHFDDTLPHVIAMSQTQYSPRFLLLSSSITTAESTGYNTPIGKSVSTRQDLGL
jgi:hypothetical protein